MLVIAKRKLALTLAPLLLLGLLSSYVVNSKQDLSGKTIIIDAGHGGIDSGATRFGVHEKDVNLSIALALQQSLHKQGARVILSRDSDMDLSGRCDNERVKGRYRRDLKARSELVQEHNAHLFISVHTNTSPSPTRRGAETFYYYTSPQSKILASLIQQELSKVAVASDKAAPGDYYVLRVSQVPAVLIELGYLSNPEDMTLLQLEKHRQLLAEAIANGICQYYRQSDSEATPEEH